MWFTVGFLNESVSKLAASSIIRGETYWVTVAVLTAWVTAVDKEIRLSY